MKSVKSWRIVESEEIEGRELVGLIEDKFGVIELHRSCGRIAQSFAEAVKAISEASKTVRGTNWRGVVFLRREIRKDKVECFQAVERIGLIVER